MKLIHTLLFVLICSVGLLAQQKRGVGLSMKALWLDYESTQSSEFEGFGGFDNGFELGFHKPLDDTWEIVVPVKLGIVDFNKDGRNVPVLHVDAQIQRHFFESKRMANPYIAAGLGYANIDFDQSHVQLPLAFGTNIRVAPGTLINFEGSYRFAFKSDLDNVQLGVGIIHYFGKYPSVDSTELLEIVPPAVIDSDGDGIVDELDNCPQVPGLEAFFGCPDSDADGIADSADKCPQIPGLPQFEGCPDTDGDGLGDLQDECPNIAGPLSNNGCPTKVVIADRDGDGVPDDIDECPYRVGEERFNGCPDSDGDGVADRNDECPGEYGLKQFQGCPDSDNDGLSDAQDRCPYVAGPINNQGCPGIRAEDQETLNFAMRAVQFEHGSSTIKRESYPIMDQIAEIINRYPSYVLSIEGHTDNTGNADYNQQLSEKRARKCYEYLANKGVSSSRISSAGYGETRPIADNNTKTGRSLNRRVEFNLSL